MKRALFLTIYVTILIVVVFGFPSGKSSIDFTEQEVEFGKSALVIVENDLLNNFDGYDASLAFLGLLPFEMRDKFKDFSWPSNDDFIEKVASVLGIDIDESINRLTDELFDIGDPIISEENDVSPAPVEVPKETKKEGTNRRRLLRWRNF